MGKSSYISHADNRNSRNHCGSLFALLIDSTSALVKLGVDVFERRLVTATIDHTPLSKSIALAQVVRNAIPSFIPVDIIAG
jgi:hypothetical protein